MLTSMLRTTYPYYLANEARRREHRSRRHRQVHRRGRDPGRAWPMPTAIDAAIAAAVDSRRSRWRRCRPTSARQILNHCVDRHFEERADELADALCIEAGKPIKDSRGEVYAPDRHVSHRGRGIGPDRRRGDEPGDFATRARLSRHVQAGADRPLFVHFAVQFPAQSGRPQGRPGDRRRLPVRAEARQPHADRSPDHRRSARRNRSAARAPSRSCPATATAPICSPPTIA